MTPDDLIYVSGTSTNPAQDAADFGPDFDGNEYSWRCPTCHAVPNCQWPLRRTALQSAAAHLQICPGEPLIPHRHIRDTVHGAADPDAAPLCYAIHKPPTYAGDPIDLVSTSEAATLLGVSSAASARKALERMGVAPIARRPGRGGESLYDAAQIRLAMRQRPGRGARTDLTR
jgi:hypothetical protein